MNIKKIGYIPFENSDNAYSERMVEILSRIGEVSRVPRFREMLTNPQLLKKNSYDAIVVNWIENCIIGSKGTVSIKGFFSLLVKIVLINYLSKKSIFVRHNNYPHESLECSSYFAAKIIDFVENLFDQVVTHSGHNENARRFYIPHPLYKHCDLIDEDNAVAGEGRYFLVFGRVLPYKKIDLLINAISEDVAIVIAGSSPDKKYVDYLCKLSSNKNVKIIPRFLTDDEAANLTRKALGVLITNNDEDMVVSGTFFFAISLGVPVYAVKSPFVEWVRDFIKLPGVYVSENVSELSFELHKVFENGLIKERPDIKLVERFFGDSEIQEKWSFLIN